MKVDFIIVGAMKCGTTTLATILSQHPEISFCTPKEPHFFSLNENWEAKQSEYHKLYKQSSNVIYGEASTSYTFSPEKKWGTNVWERIYQYNSEMKIIYIVRNPIERVISQYMHFYERGFTNYSLNEALNKVPELLSRGNYYSQIKPYVDKFGANQVYICKFDDLLKKQELVYEQISQLLNINKHPFSLIKLEKNNSSLGGGKLHQKFDWLINLTSSKLVIKIKKIIPLKLRKLIWKSFTNNESRAFTQKPKLTEEQTIKLKLKFLEEINQLEKISNLDLSSWK